MKGGLASEVGKATEDTLLYKMTKAIMRRQLLLVMTHRFTDGKVSGGQVPRGWKVQRDTLIGMDFGRVSQGRALRPLPRLLLINPRRTQAI